MARNLLHSALDKIREYAPVTHTSTFRTTGQLTPEEFLAAGDYLVYKFPSWSWADASSPAKRVKYLPDGKQFLVTRGVPCQRRLDDDFAGESGGAADDLVRDGFLGGPEDGKDSEDAGWLRTGGVSEKEQERMRGEVVSMSESTGELGKRQADVEKEDGDDDIPDMEDEDDDREAIIRDNTQGGAAAGGSAAGKPGHSGLRNYTLYITYTPYYRTPRFYLSGYEASSNAPLPPKLMMQDIVGDYKDKTVTLEDFPFTDNSTGGVKMASIHPCKHASVMKILLDRADAALKLRLQRIRDGNAGPQQPSAPGDKTGAGGTKEMSGMEGLIDDTSRLALREQERRGVEAGAKAAGAGEEWEVLDQSAANDEGDAEEEKVAIRVDQYLVVFLKFMASVTPGIEYDFTMGV